MKTFLFILLAFLSVPKMHAQQAVVVSGENATGSGGSSNYSIGQVAYLAVNGTGGSINEGVQQAFDIFTLGVDNFPEIILQMTVYPNPATSFVNLKLDNSNFQNLQYQLFDMQGRTIANEKIANPETQIEMENLPPAIYLLHVINENRIIKSFKIIKNN